LIVASFLLFLVLIFEFKDRGLVRANLKGMEQATQPVAIPQTAAAANLPNVFGSVKAGSPPQAMNAFRVQLDYAQIKSKLRPIHSGHYDAELEQQYLLMLQQQQGGSSPRPSASTLGLNWDLE
jgi:hypothetical protein